MSRSEKAPPSASSSPPRHLFLLSFGLSAVLLLFVSLNVGCPPRCDPDGLEGTAQKQFKYAGAEPTESPAGILVAVDVSRSMAGFAATNSFQQLMQNTVYSLGPLVSDSIKYFRFEVALTPVPHFQDWFAQGVFSGPAADFGRVFSMKAAYTNHIMIVVTDLQFNNQNYLIELTQLFQRELLAGRYIKIFCAVTTFDGTIFPQFGGGKKFNSSSPRPLYAVVIGEPGHADFIEGVLRRAMPWTWTMTLSNNGPVEVEVLESTALVFGQATVDGLPASYSALLQTTNGTAFSTSLRISSARLQEWNPPTPDVFQLESYEFDCERRSFTKSRAPLNVDSVGYDASSWTVHFSSSRVSLGNPVLWRICLRPTRVPPWVDELDCLPGGDQARRTVYLKKFVDDVIRPVTSPFTLATVHLHLTEE